MAVATTWHRFTVVDYHRMVSAGILAEDARVDLIAGEIGAMAPIGRRYQARLDRLADAFFHRVGERTILRVQGPIRLGEPSEPPPNFVLLRRRADY